MNSEILLIGSKAVWQLMRLVSAGKPSQVMMSVVP